MRPSRERQSMTASGANGFDNGPHQYKSNSNARCLPQQAFFTPLQIGNLTISHRIEISALTTDSGIPTELMAEYHARRAAGGAGLIIPQGTPIIPKHGMARRTWDVCPRTVGRLEVTAPRGWLHISAVVARPWGALPAETITILHRPGLGECLSTFLLTLVTYIYLCVVYILIPTFITTLPQPCRTAVALSWALCQLLFCVGICLLFPEASPTEVETMVFALYTSSIIFAYWTMGLAGPIPIIGAVLFFGVMGYITIINPFFCSTFMQHGQHQFSTKEGAAMTEGNALDVESWPQRHVADDIAPYSVYQDDRVNLGIFIFM
ncbi:uncharacterized protein LACBIDRAFT_331247 [Laccaria bicolor S238N-H82]|uniref:Predicted protein n=1 Tax=Laccaria bicolor (strain S238N-H82 / ATCC MYA-4686) TaxID=486041 RepID=B0DNW9_LACBS|nr:uncharacterized protein LACBIDRAFT_331247 [Laccaria bicolor S238N-H82]EDR03727.1 predicted protein [Laccaria bicolor S238N-H82]|eukprot:XP_001885580.1 predicted protein [Laccaria bicolor S238N-H82]